MASRHARCRRTHPREDPRHRRSGARSRARGAVAVLARVEFEADRCRARRPACHRAQLEAARQMGRSEEHTSELQSLMRISYAVFCLKKKQTQHALNCTTNNIT